MTIAEIEDKIVEEFSGLSEWTDKYSRIIEYGKECPILADKDKSDINLIQGCQSRLWLKAEFIDGKIYFSADSDAVITKGIASLLIKILSGQTPQDITDASMDCIEKIGLRAHLSPTRSNGLNAMLKQMKLYALALGLKNKVG